MRVISGKYRGSKIDGFDIDGTRPTMDRVKESMFAMIQSKLKNSVCLDLFAGSGNLGIEALSNGAKKVYFVDHNHLAVKRILMNLTKLKVDDRFVVMECDYGQALRNLKRKKVKLNLVFLDPPYRLNFINQVLEELVESELLNNHALIVCEYDKEEVASDTLVCIKERKFGDKYVKIYEYDACK